MTLVPGPSGKWHRCPDLPILPVHDAIVRAIRFVGGRGYLEKHALIFAQPVDAESFTVTINTPLYNRPWEELTEPISQEITLRVRDHQITVLKSENEAPLSSLKARLDTRRARASALACNYMFRTKPQWASMAISFTVGEDSPWVNYIHIRPDPPPFDPDERHSDWDRVNMRVCAIMRLVRFLQIAWNIHCNDFGSITFENTLQIGCQVELLSGWSPLY